ncbi:MAG: DUF2933 domain-containing protein [Pseudaminobacter sp.]
MLLLACPLLHLWHRDHGGHHRSSPPSSGDTGA